MFDKYKEALDRVKLQQMHIYSALDSLTDEVVEQCIDILNRDKLKDQKDKQSNVNNL